MYIYVFCERMRKGESERESYRIRVSVYVCVREIKRARECVFVCMSECVSDRERERERESERGLVLLFFQ